MALKALIMGGLLVVHVGLVSLMKTEKNEVILSFSTVSRIEDTERIFEPFHREESAVEGFGLGLEIVKSICDAGGVKVSVISRETITEFCYTFKGGADAGSIT